MLTLEDIKALPKVDAHNHLNLGMRYSSYSKWAGFFIPNFPRTLNGLDEMHVIISEYTRPKCATGNDVETLISLAIQDAIADGVTVLEGSIDIGFIRHWNQDVTAFLSMVERLSSIYKNSIKFKPELGMGKTFDITLIQRWAPACISSGLFKSIDLYGPEVEEGISDFKNIFQLASQAGLKKKCHVGEFSSAKTIESFVEYFELNEIQHGIRAIDDDKVLSFLAKNNIRCHVCPESNLILGAAPSLEKHPIRKMFDAGVPITINTDDLLFFNKSVSEQCIDLIQAGVFSENEIKTILQKSVE